MKSFKEIYEDGEAVSNIASGDIAQKPNRIGSGVRSKVNVKLKKETEEDE